jgi:cupin superfamily acireductone dioxygenase involved in methionine salvage
MDDLMAMTKRISILKHDYKIVHTDVLRIDHEQLKNQDNLLDKMYKPTIKESGPLIHLVTGGDVYYDILVDPNNNSANTENLENTPPEQFTDEEEDQQWIRVLLVRGDLLVIPRNQIFRSTTTGTVSSYH